MTEKSLSARLAALSEKLQIAEGRMHAKGRTTAEHTATNLELRARYNSLVQRVGEDEEAAESQGHHVGALEHSVRLWLERLDSDGI